MYEPNDEHADDYVRSRPPHITWLSVWLFVAWLILVMLLGFCATRAHADELPTITFSAQTTTGDGEVVPVLTWSAPGAASCIASGDWSGEKGASGTETLPPITRSATYNLRCTWPAKSAVTLRWTPPTENTDGSQFSDAKGFVIAYGTSPNALTQEITVNQPSPPADRFVVEDLAPGTWHFAVHVVNQRGARSDRSNVASITLSATEIERVVGIVVNPKPMPPTNLVVE